MGRARSFRSAVTGGTEKVGTLLHQHGFNKKQFMENSVRLGWYNSSEGTLFKALDIDSTGQVIAGNLAWFDSERDFQVKKGALKVKAKSNSQVQMRARVKA